MKSSAALLIVLVAAVCLISFSDAWGYRRQRGSSSRGSGRSNRTNSTYLLVRRVDEPHPYFRTMNVSANSSLAELKARLGEFFNKSADNITMLVKNDVLLLTRDVEARMLKFKDQLEVTFSECGAPTRAKTQYAYSKDARRSLWSDKKQKDSKKKDKKTDRPAEAGGRGRPDREDRRRRPANPEAEDEANEAAAMEELEFF